MEKVKAGIKQDLQSTQDRLACQGQRSDRGSERSDQDPGLHLDLPPQARRHAAQSFAGVLSNVFLHLHPAKINRDAVRYRFTWGMGGITFYLFIVLTFTGVLLMFYYHPTKVDAFRDILYLEHDVPFGKLLAQHASLGRAPDGDHDLAAHVSRGADRLVQKAARV